MLKMSNNKLIKRINKMPIGNKITFLYALVFCIVLVVTSVCVVVNAWYYYRNVSRNELSNTVDKIKEYILNAEQVDLNYVSEINDNKYIEIRVSTKDKQHLFEGMREPENFPPPSLDNKNRSGIGERDHFATEIIQNQPYMSLQEKVERDGQIYFIQVFRPYRHEQKVIKLFGIIFFIVNILAILVAYKIGRYISQRLLQPVREMTATAEQISIHDLNQRINVPLADDEIRTLAITFNDMFERLQISFEKQNQFISDASHELRTPISVIQGYANLIDRWGKSDSEVLDEAIKSIKDETDHMANLVKQLLFIAREEENSKNIQKEVVDLGQVAVEVVKEANVLETKSNITLTETNADIFADYHLIKQLIWIFTENAIKYADKDEGIVAIKVWKDSDYAYISVKDNGIGINQEDINHIFDRFYRGDKSRNKDTPGNGLGLSIAKWIIKQHNACVKVESELGKGTDFIVKIPVYIESKSNNIKLKSK